MKSDYKILSTFLQQNCTYVYISLKLGLYPVIYSYFSLNYQVSVDCILRKYSIKHLLKPFSVKSDSGPFSPFLTNFKISIFRIRSICYGPVNWKSIFEKVQKSLGAYSKDLTISYNIILLCDNVLWRLICSRALHITRTVINNNGRTENLWFSKRIYDVLFVIFHIIWSTFSTHMKSNPPKRGKEAKEKKEMDISKTAYGTPKSKFNLGQVRDSFLVFLELLIEIR